MTTYSTRAIIITLLVTATATPLLRSSEATAATTASATPLFSSAADEAAYEWTRDLLETNGFDFPTVDIEFHATDAPCGGMRGRTNLSNDDHLTAIHVCATHDNRAVEEAWRRRALLHEVAHAWIDQNVGTAHADDLMELRDVAVWWSRDQAWEHRGAEHAAEIFMWGVQDGDYEVDFRIAGTECSDLSAGYELLTGEVVTCDRAA